MTTSSASSLVADALQVPSDFVDGTVHVSLKHLVQAKTPNGQVVPAFLAVVGTLLSQTPSSIVVRVSDECILGPAGEHCIPKESIGSVVRVSRIATPRIMS